MYMLDFIICFLYKDYFHAYAYEDIAVIYLSRMPSDINLSYEAVSET